MTEKPNFPNDLEMMAKISGLPLERVEVLLEGLNRRSKTIVVREFLQDVASVKAGQVKTEDIPNLSQASAEAGLSWIYNEAMKRGDTTEEKVVVAVMASMTYTMHLTELRKIVDAVYSRKEGPAPPEGTAIIITGDQKTFDLISRTLEGGSHGPPEE